MFIHFNATGKCDDCGNPRGTMLMQLNRPDCSIKLCTACVRALVHALNHALGKLTLVDRASPIAGKKMASTISHADKETKEHHLAVIKRQSQQMVDLGFLGSPSAAWLAHTESELRKLDLSTLQAIARASERLLEAAAKLESI
jgi:hypothetical protein